MFSEKEEDKVRRDATRTTRIMECDSRCSAVCRMDRARKSGALPTAHRRARTRLESLLEPRERARRRDHRPRLRHPEQGRPNRLRKESSTAESFLGRTICGDPSHVHEDLKTQNIVIEARGCGWIGDADIGDDAFYHCPTLLLSVSFILTREPI